MSIYIYICVSVCVFNLNKDFPWEISKISSPLFSYVLLAEGYPRVGYCSLKKRVAASMLWLEIRFNNKPCKDTSRQNPTQILMTSAG